MRACEFVNTGLCAPHERVLSAALISAAQGLCGTTPATTRRFLCAVGVCAEQTHRAAREIIAHVHPAATCKRADFPSPAVQGYGKRVASSPQQNERWAEGDVMSKRPQRVRVPQTKTCHARNTLMCAVCVLSIHSA